MTLTALIKSLRSKISRLEKKLGKTDERVGKAIETWKREYAAYNARVAKLGERIVKGMRMNTVEVMRMVERNEKWPERSRELTQKRDKARAERKEIEKEIENLKIELATALERASAETKEDDTIVEQVFAFRNGIVAKFEEMVAFLNAQVYNRLIDPDGNLRSQLTINNTDGTKRLVAMVNSISKIDPALAKEALAQISAFFERILPQEEKMDEATSTLYELTQKILIEKTSFKVGPDLYRFLSLELKEKMFPELVKAQNLLKRSLRSEKTTSYIRLYKRESRTEKFQAVKLTA